MDGITNLAEPFVPKPQLSNESNIADKTGVETAAEEVPNSQQTATTVNQPIEVQAANRPQEPIDVTATPSTTADKNAEPNDRTSVNNNCAAAFEASSAQECSSPPIASFAVQHQFQDPVTSFFRKKNVLLTGVTGFIGKAILWKLIDTLREDIGNIYLLIRSGNVKRSKLGRPADRLKNEVINDKAFQILRYSMGEEAFDSIVKSRLIPVPGDLISPDLSIPSSERERIIKNVQLVIHCAATLHFTERLDLALETNTLGTLRLMDLADECDNMEGFLHLSPAYVDPSIPDGHIQERVYPMPIGEPEELLSQIIDLELQDIPKMTERILAHYPNTYTFTKALTEHLILKRADINRIEEIQGGKVQWPIAIVRATQVGAGAFEPLRGWVDGVTGASSIIFLMSQGTQALQPSLDQSLADIVPVDFAVRVILGVCACMSSPGCRFVLPYNERLKEDEQFTENPNILYFPYIYQISACAIDEATWSNVHNSVQYYWNRNASLSAFSYNTAATGPPTANGYFAASRPLFKQKFFTKYGSLSRSLSTLATSINGTTGKNSSSSSSSSDASFSRLLDAASRVVEAMQPFLSRQWVFNCQNVQNLEQRINAATQFSLGSFQHLDWHTYITDFTYGIHHYVMPTPPPNLRRITVPEGWACALYLHPGAAKHSIIDHQIESVVFSASDIRKRTERMLTALVSSIEKPDHNLSRDKKKLEQWIDDFDASLDDWCHDDSDILKNRNDMTHLGHWRNIMPSTDATYDEHLRIEVLNDTRVGQSIKQIVESSGVPQNTAVGEALKIYQRMKERTQLPYVWSAGAFLNALFKRLFSTVRLNVLDIARLKEHIQDKNVVYVPASKTIIDQLIVWYICLRYRLPVPAIVCDEALALLGPISDIFRIAGALFIRRDTQSRSPLNTAVASAYIALLMRKHGALSMVIERARSRTGRLQPAYNDGLIDMVTENTTACLRNKHQHSNEGATSGLDSPPSLESKPDKRTVLVPVNITYEKIPELQAIVDQVLQQRPSNMDADIINGIYDRSRPAKANEPSSKKSARESSVLYGRVYVGFGKIIDVEKLLQKAEERESSRDTSDPEEDVPYTITTREIQSGQHEAIIVSPVALVAATILYGRVTNGITMGKLRNLVLWLREILLEKQVPVDWQNDEDVDTIISYAFELMDTHESIIVADKRMTEHTVIRVVEHADNTLKLSYMSSPLVEIFLPEAIFSVLYLSQRNRSSTKKDLFAEFTFLVQLLGNEFIYPWDCKKKFNSLFDSYAEKRFFEVDGEGQYKMATSTENDEEDYSRICVLASLLYPTLDAYWVTSCSLSALRDLSFMPRKTVPVLSQWIATHLIAGRRTMYREVLSVEASQNAIGTFLALGFIDAVQSKAKLSPDAQILLLELGVTTNDDLVMVSTANKDKEEKSTNVPTDHDIASLCHRIEKYRFAPDSGQFSHLNDSQVFDKCQNQIRSILRAEQTYAAQRGMSLHIEEDQMVQLVYSLKAASEAPLISETSFEKHSRRISQAYNLRNAQNESK